MITYFIQSGDYVKIGQTRNIAKRMNTIRCYSPVSLKLLKACDIPESVAHAIASGKTARANGEWFMVNPDLLDWIAEIQDTVHLDGFSYSNSTDKGRVRLALSPEFFAYVSSSALESGVTLSAHIEHLVDGILKTKKNGTIKP